MTDTVASLRREHSRNRQAFPPCRKPRPNRALYSRWVQPSLRAQWRNGSPLLQSGFSRVTRSPSWSADQSAKPPPTDLSPRQDVVAELEREPKSCGVSTLLA